MDDRLKRLETRFEPAARKVVWWNSDRVFGSASMPISSQNFGPALVESIVDAHGEFCRRPRPAAWMSSTNSWRVS